MENNKKSEQRFLELRKKMAEELSRQVETFLYYVDEKDAPNVIEFWKFLDKYEGTKNSEPKIQERMEIKNNSTNLSSNRVHIIQFI